MEEEVAALVLRDNYEQAQALSSSVAQAGSMAEVHERYIRSLEQSGVLAASSSSSRTTRCSPSAARPAAA